MRKANLPVPPALPDEPAERLATLQARLAAAARAGGHPPPALIGVAKTQAPAAILPLIAAGHRLFGENRVQEAAAKWPALRLEYPDIELHLVGQLQSNKAEEAVRLFDAIHSVDRPSLVSALAKAQAATGRQPLLFGQVNVGAEPQKGGVAIAALPQLLAAAAAAGLSIRGLMAVPPADREPAPYLALLAKLARRHALPLLSMGMSADAELAASLGATHVRIGTALFGRRQTG